MLPVNCGSHSDYQNFVVTSCRERKHCVCICKENGITDCRCDRYFSQPDCDIGWDFSRDCFFHGYDLYMLVNSESDLPDLPFESTLRKLILNVA